MESPEESRDPSLIRQSLVLVMLIVVSLYLVLNVPLVGSRDAAALAASPAPLATAAGIVFAHSGPVVAFGGIIAMLSAMNAYIIGKSRVIHTMSARFSFPLLQDLSRQGTPVRALVLGCVSSGLLLLVSNRFDALATISVITTLVPFIFFCFAAWILVAERKVHLIAADGTLSTVAILLLYFLVWEPFLLPGKTSFFHRTSCT